jgi:hypothetical protein
MHPLSAPPRNHRPLDKMLYPHPIDSRCLAFSARRAELRVGVRLPVAPSTVGCPTEERRERAGGRGADASALGASAASAARGRGHGCGGGDGAEASVCAGSAPNSAPLGDAGERTTGGCPSGEI